MIVRTTMGALVALAIAAAALPAAAQQEPAGPAIEAPMPTMTAQVAPAPTAAVPTAAAPEQAESDNEARPTNMPRCRWESPNRRGVEFILVPLDIFREGLSSLRRGTVRRCSR